MLEIKRDEQFEGKTQCAALCDQVACIPNEDNTAFLMAAIAYKMGLERGRADSDAAVVKGEG